MNTSTKDLLKKAIMKKIVLEKKKNEIDLLEFLKGKKLVPDIRTGTSLKPGNLLLEHDDKVISPKSYKLFNTMVFTEYDKDEDSHVGVKEKKAKFENCVEAPYFINTSFAYEDIGEMSLSLVQGQLFGTLYPNFKEQDPVPPFFNQDCSYLNKKINLPNPFLDNIFIKTDTYVFLPENPASVYYADLGNSGMAFCGIESNIRTHLSYENLNTSDLNDRVYVSSGSKRLMRVLRAQGQADVDEYLSFIKISNNIILPAGMTEFAYNIYWELKTHTSRDFTNCEEIESDKFGIVLVDLRSRQYGDQYPIARNPITGELASPPGGAKTVTVLEFYNIQNALAI